ncbi:hypothetical protein VNO77_04206 [Canavalia gladiata]|uniref:Disease resistance protein Roq1-like winged-helix domain-containing protein n=1 Tax=Canavalia gladiata TaxID=3824 RepID=A0AAN9R7K0_CANGL
MEALAIEEEILSRENFGNDGQALRSELISKLLKEYERRTSVESSIVRRRLYCKRVFIVLDDGQCKERVTSILNSYGFYADIGLRTLQDNALITIENDAVQMHDLMQEMGWEIVRQESIKEPGGRSRLWDPKEVYDVLKNNRDLVNLKRIDLRQSKWLTELPDFTMSSNLEEVLLSGCESLPHIHPSILSLQSLVTLDLDRYKEVRSLESASCLRSLEYICLYGCSRLEKFSVSSEEIRILILKEVSIEVLPSTIGHLSRLEHLEIQNLRLKNLPNELSCLGNLKNLYILDCPRLMINKQQLQVIFHGLHSLQMLFLTGCSYLTEVPDNISILSSLYSLDLHETNIECLPESIKQLTKLEHICLNDCKRFRSLPEFPQSVIKINLKRCNIEYLPTNIKQIANLEYLDLHDCKRLLFLPELPQSIECLDISMCCKSLWSLPNLPQSIIDLDISGSNIGSLAESINQLTNLIYFHNCGRLRSLPKLPQSVTRFELNNCTSLERVNSTGWKKKRYFSINLRNCVNLDEHVKSSILENTNSSTKESVYRRFYICLPGSRVPEWFKDNRTTRDSITIELDRHRQIIAFVLCIVLCPFSSNKGLYTFFVECYQDGVTPVLLDPKQAFNRRSLEVETQLNSNHVRLWSCSPVYSLSKSRTTRNLSFKFVVKSVRRRKPHPDTTIKECGVFPIYGIRE